MTANIEAIISLVMILNPPKIATTSTNNKRIFLYFFP